jgi:hypothetical protein
MIDWIKTVQGIAAIVAVIFATMVAWWNLSLPRLAFSPELAPVHRRIEVARAILPGHPVPGSRPDPGGAPIRSRCSGRRGMRCSLRRAGVGTRQPQVHHRREQRVVEGVVLGALGQVEVFADRAEPQVDVAAGRRSLLLEVVVQGRDLDLPVAQRNPDLGRICLSRTAMSNSRQ